MLQWILGYFCSLPRGVSPRLEWGHARVLSSRAVAAVSVSLRVDQGICGFPSRLPHEAFPRGFPTGLSHVPPWCESILGLKDEAVQGKQVSLEWTETSVGLWEWWHDTGVPLLFPVESAPSTLHGDWPFMRPTERVSEVQVVSRELLLQLEKIQEVLPSRRDVAHIR